MSGELFGLLICGGIVETLQAIALGVILYRMTARHILDPLGHDGRLHDLSKRVLTVEMRQVDLAAKQADMERRLFERLDDVRDTQSKMLGEMASVISRVDAEQRERQEISTSLAQLFSAVSNVGRRFDGIEDGLRRVLDARPGATA